MNEHNPYLYKLMQNLLYPAMLGTFFVLVISEFGILFEQPSKIFQLNFLYSVLLIIYFCASFLVNENISNLESYKVKTFLFDFLEVVLMFVCFNFLRIDESYSNEYPLRYFYFAISGIPFIQLLWNVSLGDTPRTYLILDIIGIILFLIAGIWLYKFIVINYIFFFFILLIVGYYLYFLTKRDTEWWSS